MVRSRSGRLYHGSWCVRCYQIPLRVTKILLIFWLIRVSLYIYIYKRTFIWNTWSKWHIADIQVKIEENSNESRSDLERLAVTLFPIIPVVWRRKQWLDENSGNLEGLSATYCPSDFIHKVKMLYIDLRPGRTVKIGNAPI